MIKPRDLIWPTLPVLSDGLDLAALLQRDEVPIPAAEDRERYYAGQNHHYWLSGFCEHQSIRRAIPELPAQGLRVLDFGGATGRVSRHFLLSGAASEIVIAETNPRYVDWINRFFGKNAKGVLVGNKPVFPLPDHVFDLAFGISVFTHIDADEIVWLRELVRVVKPGGYIYMTIFSEQGWSNAELGFLRSIVDSPHFPTPRNPQVANINKYYAAAAGGALPAERFSVRTSLNIINHCNTFHSTDYIKQVWGQFADIQRIVYGQHGDLLCVDQPANVTKTDYDYSGYQTAVILKNNKAG